MKLNMGPNANERDRFDLLETNQIKNDISLWHPHFAVWPVRIGDSQEGRWLETVERRAKSARVVRNARNLWVIKHDGWEYRCVQHEGATETARR